MNTQTNDPAQQALCERYEFRTIRAEEAMEAAEIEQICFPPNEACSTEMMLERVNTAPELFLVAVEKSSGQIVGFLNGLSTRETVFRDAFFTDAGLHDPSGTTIMLLGLDVLPAHRGQGLAREIVSRYLRLGRDHGATWLLLTCLDSKVQMYEKFGFADLGAANSTWGGETWHEMCYVL